IPRGLFLFKSPKFFLTGMLLIDLYFVKVELNTVAFVEVAVDSVVRAFVQLVQVLLLHLDFDIVERKNASSSSQVDSSLTYLLDTDDPLLTLLQVVPSL